MNLVFFIVVLQTNDIKNKNNWYFVKKECPNPGIRNRPFVKYPPPKYQGKKDKR